MAPASSKANYKTYEAQARMVRAIVAAHPDVKWNYKEIISSYGSDMSEHALNHRFRRLKAQAVIIREGRKQGFDMKDLAHEVDLPGTQDKVDKKNIAKYFGQSTADGIQFQFRTIKKDADLLRKVERDGGNVANCLSLGGGAGPGGGSGGGSLATTPSRPAPSRGTGSRSARTTTGGGRKRTRMVHIKRTSSDEEDDDDDDDDNDNDDQDAENWSERDETPSKRPRTTLSGGAAGGAAGGGGGGAFPGQKTGTPSRRAAAAKAAVTIAEATAQLDTSDSQPEVDTPTTAMSFAPLLRDSPVTTSTSTIAANNNNNNNHHHHHHSAVPSAAPRSIFGPVDRKPTMMTSAAPPSSFYGGNSSIAPMGTFPSPLQSSLHHGFFGGTGLPEDFMTIPGGGRRFFETDGNDYSGDGEI